MESRYLKERMIEGIYSPAIAKTVRKDSVAFAWKMYLTAKSDKQENKNTIIYDKINLSLTGSLA